MKTKLEDCAQKSCASEDRYYGFSMDGVKLEAFFRGLADEIKAGNCYPQRVSVEETLTHDDFVLTKLTLVYAERKLNALEQASIDELAPQTREESKVQEQRKEEQYERNRNS